MPHDPSLIVLNALLAAHPPIQTVFPAEIIDPNGTFLGRFEAGNLHESVIEVYIHGSPYYLLQGWVKHEPYHFMDSPVERQLDGLEPIDASLQT